MSEATELRLLRAAIRKRAKTAEANREATEDLRRQCRAARAAGIPVTLIASEMGLSRQGVYDLLAERPSS
jgi:DNA invertase Pin-like site-specific DNA recombinase